MLDDANVVAQRDPQDALGFAAKQPEQLAHNFGLAQRDFGNQRINNVVFAGMGGSSLVAELVHTWPRLNKPFVIWKNYGLPDFVDQDTLVICASYSGNTEETLSALAEAQTRRAQIVVMAHGGKLFEIAKEKDYLLAELPVCPQPRASVLYGYRAVVEILVAARLVTSESIAELESLIALLEQAIAGWTQDIPKGHNVAKQLAEHMIGKTPIIYARPYPQTYANSFLNFSTSATGVGLTPFSSPI